MTPELLIRPTNSVADWERLKHCRLGRLCRPKLVKVVMTFDSNWGRQCVLEFWYARGKLLESTKSNLMSGVTLQVLLRSIALLHQASRARCASASI